MTSRSTAVADELADSVDRLHRLLDAASFEFAEFRSSRAALAEQISSFIGGLHAAVGQHDAALPEPPASSTPWQQVPALAIEDAALRTAVDGQLAWDAGIDEKTLKSVAWGIAAEIVYAFDVKWSPDWVAKGHPHRWHDEDGWHARCNDCLDESPAEPDESVAYRWFADHRPAAHGDSAPPFRPSPPPLEVPMPE